MHMVFPSSAAMTTVFGVHDQTKHTVPMLYELYSQTQWIVYQVNTVREKSINYAFKASLCEIGDNHEYHHSVLDWGANRDERRLRGLHATQKAQALSDLYPNIPCCFVWRPADGLYKIWLRADRHIF